MNYFDTIQGKAFIENAVMEYIHGKEVKAAPTWVICRENIDDKVIELTAKGDINPIRNAVEHCLRPFDILIEENNKRAA